MSVSAAGPAILLLTIVLGTSVGSAQTRQLSIDDLDDPTLRLDFSGQPPSDLTWISETHYIWPKPLKGGSVDWLKVTAATGAAEPLFDAQKFRAAFDGLPGLREEDARTLPNDSDLVMNTVRNAALISIGEDLYHYAFGAERAVRLTFDPYAEEEFSFSPDGRQVAFV
jgi:hypothetical protein